MKKSILATVLLSGLALSVASTTVSAAEVETSKVEVNLTKDDGHEVGTGPFLDKLTIVHKPTVFKFEGSTTTGSLQLSNAHPRKDNQFISVNDDRKDTSGAATTGKWELEGQLSELSAASGDLAANMLFTPEALIQYDIGAAGNQPSGSFDYAPAEIDPTATAADAAKYKLSSSFTLAAGGAPVKFLESTTDSASGLKGVATNLGNVDLLVATGDATEAGTYTGTITWTLTAK